MLAEVRSLPGDIELKKMNTYGSYWSNYFNFQGRTRRGVYWTTTIINLTIWFLVANWLEGYSSTLRDAWLFLWGVVNIIPDTAIQARRLRDAGKGQIHLLWHEVPLLLVCLFALLYYMSKSEEIASVLGILILIGTICKIPLIILLFAKSKTKPDLK